MKIKLLIIFYWFSLFFGLYYYDLNWIILLSIILSALFGIIFHHFIIHEHFAHKKYNDTLTNKFLGSLMTLFPLGSPMEYALIHRQHHKYADESKDPHSPKHMGVWPVFFFKINTQNLELFLVKDFLKSKFQKFLNNYYFSLVVIVMLIAFIINPKLLFFVLAPMAAYTALSAQIISSFAHKDGKPQNNKWIKFINFLEWKHYNHHKYYNKKFIA